MCGVGGGGYLGKSEIFRAGQEERQELIGTDKRCHSQAEFCILSRKLASEAFELIDSGTLRLSRIIPFT